MLTDRNRVTGARAYVPARRPVGGFAHQVHIPFDEGTGASVLATVRTNRQDRPVALDITNHNASAWTDRAGWYTPTSTCSIDLTQIPAIQDVIGPRAGHVAVIAVQLYVDPQSGDNGTDTYTLLGYNSVSPVAAEFGYGYDIVASGATTVNLQQVINLVQGASTDRAFSGAGIRTASVDYTGAQICVAGVIDWDNIRRSRLTAQPSISKMQANGSELAGIDGGTTLNTLADGVSLFARADGGGQGFNDEADLQVSVRELYIGLQPKYEIDRPLDNLIRANDGRSGVAV